MKKQTLLCLLLAAAMLLGLTACGGNQPAGSGAVNTGDAASPDGGEPSTLVYASGDYTRINPAMDEHGEINILLFNGLTAHDGSNSVIPGLAESWAFDEDTCTYTFHLTEGVKWHDGQPLTAEDVQFTIRAIMDQIGRAHV